MTSEVPPPVLKGAKALVVGVANQYSIAYGCAKAFRELGAELAITYVNEKTKTYVEPLAKDLGAPIFMPLDVAAPGMLEAVFDRITKEWGQLDILVHSIAYAPKDDLQGLLVNCSVEGFKQAMDVSCHSFVRMARLAVPLMKNGGPVFAMSYHGANKVVPNYNVMGPVKAALEASCRYLAFELGDKGIRVHAISPGPLKTRAASSLKGFDLLLNEAAHRAPIGELIDIMDVGFTCAFLATPYARRLSGATQYVDGGVNIKAAELTMNPTSLSELWAGGARYGVDFAQRSILFWDTLRQRGNNFLEHERQGIAAGAALRLRDRDGRALVQASGQLRAAAHRSAQGRDRGPQTPALRDHRPARRSRPGHRRLQGRFPSRRRIARRASRVLRHLLPESRTGTDAAGRVRRRARVRAPRARAASGCARSRES